LQSFFNMSKINQ